MKNWKKKSSYRDFNGFEDSEDGERLDVFEVLKEWCGWSTESKKETERDIK